MAQALVEYLAAQRVERDGQTQPLFAGCFGIFGHGNVAGVGQALQQHALAARAAGQAPALPYTPWRNEQAMVHAAVGYARMKNRLGVYACTTSIGPGATNLVTGAALATINRLPVLLLPGDIFARRNVAPVLQQLEHEASQDISVNDCLRPVSRYWDRINRADQLVYALPEAMRVLTSPAQTGAVTLALPQDTQTEAYDYPAGLFAPRVWHVPRPRPDEAALARAAAAIRASERPLIVAGGGVIYSEACAALRALSEATGVPVTVSQAGKGALSDEHALCLGAVGVTGTSAANIAAREADVIIGVGTRYSDFTTASHTAFAAAHTFVNVNVAEFDAHKQHAIALTADARVTLEALAAALEGYSVALSYRERCATLRDRWHTEVARVFGNGATTDEASADTDDDEAAGLPTQGQLIGALAEFSADSDVVINAAGSGPGDLHKLWPARLPGTYHVEYGYSCMGYEIPGGVGVKLAAPEREVYVIIGDGSYLMLSSDLATAVQEGIKVTVVLINNHGYSSIGGLSQAVGSGGFGTHHRARSDDGAGGQEAPGRGDGVAHGGGLLPVDFVKNAESLGALALQASDLASFRAALERARGESRTTVIVVETDREQRVGGYESWWDVPVAEVSEVESVRAARAAYEVERARERCYHGEDNT